VKTPSERSPKVSELCGRLAPQTPAPSERKRLRSYVHLGLPLFGKITVNKEKERDKRNFIYALIRKISHYSLSSSH
jgi:hypothetical protein